MGRAGTEENLTSYFTSRRYDEALAAADETVAMHPEFRAAYLYRGWVLLLKQAHADAVSSLLAAGEGTPRAHIAVEACLVYQAVLETVGLADAQAPLRTGVDTRS